MKRFALIAVAALALSGCATQQPPASQQVRDYYAANSTLKPVATEAPKFTRPEGRPARVLFTGDSLAGGYYASSKDKAFPALVQAAIGPVEVTQAALAHQTLTTVSRITDVPADLDLAVVELGTNDVGVPTPPADFDGQYTALLAKIKEKSPNAAVVCVSTWTPNGQTYDTLIRDACADVDGVFVSIIDENKNPANHGPAGVETEVGLSDTFHPNNAGHAAIAGKITAALGL